jgi:beta-lactam-binding protein with PASTA domain
VTVPSGSSTGLSNSTLVNPTFVADVAGTFTVQLTVSDGSTTGAPATVTITVMPRTVAVLAVTGLIPAEAEAAVTAAALAVGTISTANSDTVAAGRVISQSPAAGTSVEEGSPVDLVVSLGPEITMPTVSISATPEVINIGETATLTWSSTKAESCYIEPGIGSVPPSGSTAVSRGKSQSIALG